MTNTSAITTPTTPETDARQPRRTTYRRRSTPLLDALDREWSRLRRRPSTLEHVRAWDTSGALARAIGAACSLDDIVDATQPWHAGDESATDVLCALIDLAGTHELAGRIVLQRMLPGLVTQTNKWVGDQRSSLDAVLGAAWIAIRRYDTRRRRRCVTPALIADAMWLGLRRERRLKSATEMPLPSSILGAAAAPAAELDAVTALAGTLRAATRAGVADEHIGFIRTLAAAGTPTRAAEQCQVHPRTIRNRRDAASSSIREALGTDWMDWTDPLVNAA